MVTKKRAALFVIGSLAIMASRPPVYSQGSPRTVASGGVRETLAAAAGDNATTFILFRNRNDSATAAMRKVLATNLRNVSQPVVQIEANPTDAREAVIVKELGVARAPLPLLVAVAPNGAITGFFPRRLDPQGVKSCLVTRGMMQCLKALQDEHLVFLCVTEDGSTALPSALPEFQSDPHFKNRMTVVTVQATDAAEQVMFRDLGIESGALAGTPMFVLAPPGAMVGRFAPSVSKADIAAAIAAAGKCCNDPNCKHNRR